MLFLFTFNVMAQPPHGGGWEPGDGKPPWAGGNNCFPPPCVPFEGLEILLTLGCIYGTYKLKEK